jgi:tetratricopeptide (TPR) repeat protein
MHNSKYNKSSFEKESPQMEGRLGAIGTRNAIYVFVLGIALTFLWHDCGRGDTPQSDQNPEPEVLLNNLNDARYKVRREAFLKLCDNKLPIDDYLVKESESSDFNRSRVAAWLIKLRKSSGDPARKFEMLAEYQSMLAGDNSPLFQRIVDGRWNEVLELLRTVPHDALRDLLERETRKNLLESRFVSRLIDQAWRSGNEWAVPQIVDIFASNENRVGINLWWRELGMPEEWRISEPNDPKITVIRLASQGKYDEALKLASAGRMKAEFERIAIESGNWDAYLNGTTQSNVIPASGLQSKMKSWALAFANNDQSQADQLWEEIKKLRTAGPKRGHATLALVMDDPVYFEEVIGTLNEVDAFNALYYTGRIKEAFRKVGLNELTPSALREWLKRRSDLFERSDNGDPMMVNRDLLEMCTIAFHNLGIPGLEETFDKAWMEFVSTKVSGDGPDAMMPMIENWVRFNQRDKAVKYLIEYSKKNANSVVTWLRASVSPTDMDGRREGYSLCIERVYGGQIAEPTLILQHLFTLQQEGSAAAKLESSLQILNDLYHGRKPQGWDGSKELNNLKRTVLAQSLGEAEFAKSLAELFDLFGDTREAFKTLQESLGVAAGSSEEYFWLLASYQEKLGFPRAASDTLLELVNTSSNLETLVRTLDLLETTGRYADIDRLRFRWLSCVSRRNEPTNAFFLDDSKIYHRPEIEMVYDRWGKVAWSIEQSDSEIRYRIAKNDLTKAPRARRSAVHSLILIAPTLAVADDFRSRMLFQALIGPFALDAVFSKDADRVTKWLEAAARLEPGHIQIPIDIIPEADKNFDKATVDKWFDLFWNKMKLQIDEFPNDAMTLNNVAWMASQCNRRLDEAILLSRRAVELRPVPTYMDTLADLEFRVGNVEKAIELSQKCREMEPRDEQHKKQLKRFFSSIKP